MSALLMATGRAYQSSHVITLQVHMHALAAAATARVHRPLLNVPATTRRAEHRPALRAVRRPSP